MEQFILEGNLADKHLPKDPTLRSIGCIPVKPEASLGKSAIMCAAKRIHACRVRHCVCIRTFVYALVGVVSKFSAMVCAPLRIAHAHTSRECIRCRWRGRGRMDGCAWGR